LEVVGLIPARGGSKGIPRKNLAPLAGRPLLAYTVEAALGSEALTKTVVSTDSPEIADVARALGAKVPFLRPADLARDETPMRDVLLHALDELGGCDVLVLLQPTSPLRRSRHVDDAVRLLLESGADTVVSVVEVPHQFRVASLMELVGERLIPLEPPATRRQDKPLLYARNGPAVLALRAESFQARPDLYGPDCRPYVMDALESVDVDTEDDLRLAELLLGSRR
jgi:CMP-N,N'-diacetyllegionaminic acid synthase